MSEIYISGGAVSFENDPSHPNQMILKGVLVRLDEPSTKPPGGAEGHRILLPTDIAKERLSTLLNMGLNYSPALDTHAQRRKVGTIVKAWIDGKDLCIQAVVWKHDFPEAEQDLKQKGLGMSMEIGSVCVEDPDAQVWKITDFYFLGATVLWKDAAAYYRTQAIAAKGASTMTKTAKKKTTATAAVQPDGNKVVEMAAGAAAEAVKDLLLPTINRQTQILAGLATRLDSMELQILGSTELEAKGKKEEDEKACDNMESKAKDDEDDEDEEDDEDDDEDIDAEDVNKGSLEETGPDTSDDADDDDEPGHINKGAMNKGSKTTCEDTVGKTVASARLKQQIKSNRELSARVAELEKQLATASKRQARTEKQVAASAAQTARRSAVVLDPSTLGLLQKSGLDATEIKASGQKLTIAEVDAMLAGSEMDTVKRMEMKNHLLRAGVMEEGTVKRAWS